MTVIYRTAGAWGSGKGSNLTPAEVDGNFYDHEGRIAAIEGSPPTPVEIASIDVNEDGELTVTMDDDTTYGPFQIPVTAFTWRGDWAASAYYNLYDVVYAINYGVYIVMKEHTSPSVFDENHAVSGVKVYNQMMTDVDFPVNEVVETDVATSRDLTLADRGTYIRFTDNSTGPTLVDLPPDSVVAWPEGTRITLGQWGAANVELTFDSTVTVNAKSGCDFTTVEEGSVVTLIKVGDNEWDYFGDHGFVSV